MIVLTTIVIVATAFGQLTAIDSQAYTPVDNKQTIGGLHNEFREYEKHTTTPSDHSMDAFYSEGRDLTTTSTKTVECVDIQSNKLCNSWTRQGFCTTSDSATYMLSNCCASCRSDSTTKHESYQQKLNSTGSHMYSDKDITCKNIKSDEQCKRWKASGFCTSQPTNMIEICCKTCSSNEDNLTDDNVASYKVSTIASTSNTIDNNPGEQEGKTITVQCQTIRSDGQCEKWKTENNSTSTATIKRIMANCCGTCISKSKTELNETANVSEYTGEKSGSKLSYKEVTVQCENVRSEGECERWQTRVHCFTTVTIKHVMIECCSSWKSNATFTTENMNENTSINPIEQGKTITTHCINSRSTKQCEWRKAKGYCTANATRKYMAKTCCETCTSNTTTTFNQTICKWPCNGSFENKSSEITNEIDNTITTAPAPSQSSPQSTTSVFSETIYDNTGALPCKWPCNGNFENISSEISNEKDTTATRPPPSPTTTTTTATSTKPTTSTATTTSIDTKACHDVAPKFQCETWKTKGYCTDVYRKEDMLNNCCSTCFEANNTAKIETTSPCRDIHPKDTCEAWKSKGYCSSVEMEKECCETCNKAQQFIEESCVNSVDDKKCELWKSRGYCTNQYQKSMTENCCLTCSTSSTIKPMCTDKEKVDDCSRWKSQGYCERLYVKFMKDKCCGTCGYMDGAPE